MRAKNTGFSLSEMFDTLAHIAGPIIKGGLLLALVMAIVGYLLGLVLHGKAGISPSCQAVSRLRIKIFGGVTHPDDAVFAARLGVDAIGHGFLSAGQEPC